jgi:hypothetical protein
MPNEWSRDEIALAVALIAFGGVFTSAVLNLVSSNRSKYVDTVTNQRIKWVGELRSDFSKFIAGITQLWTLKKSEGENGQFETEYSELYERMVLISLKLNLRSPLDREISNLMRQCTIEIFGGDYKRVELANGELAKRVADLLKEEWEAAKWESSGPIRRVRIAWNRRRRWKEYQRRWLRNSAEGKTPLPASERSVFTGAPDEPKTR